MLDEHLHVYVRVLAVLPSGDGAEYGSRYYLIGIPLEQPRRHFVGCLDPLLVVHGRPFSERLRGI
jgi:hypothetical protein